MNSVMNYIGTPLQQLNAHGQSLWLDYISKELIDSGQLQRMIRADGLKGLTSNPTIFEKAISGGSEYHASLQKLATQVSLSNAQIFEQLAINDIRQAADLFMPVYQTTQRRDGYVSLEVSPELAYDTDRTVAEARRLWHEVGRANLMIKIPATAEGIAATEILLAEGININVTLLFSVAVYTRVVEAYLRAMERRHAAGLPLAALASVASFFVSRVDTAVDRLITSHSAQLAGPAEASRLLALRGGTAIANAKLAYRHYQQIFSGERWAKLAAAGAQTQRLLWASTSSKDPDYRDVLYVEELIGRDTVNTVPLATLNAFREHGRVRPALTEDLAGAEHAIASLAVFGIQLDDITDTLLDEGVRSFRDAYDKLLGAIDTACCANFDGQRLMAQLNLPAQLHAEFEKLGNEIISTNRIQRLWQRDRQLWTNQDEDQWLDWLDIVGSQLRHLVDLNSIRHLGEGYYYRHLVLLGMGGASLAAELFARCFPPQNGHPQLLILDSTDPAQIRSLEANIDLARTAFIVASKSGTTLESNLLLDYFYARVSAVLGEALAPKHFGVITDPGTALEARGRQAGFRKIIHGVPGIGGRYSALSNFGMVPAAIAGIDVGRLLRQAQDMARACARGDAAADNPGLRLGAVLAAAHRLGRDKITLICSPAIHALGAWLEQLLAESTGKQGRGFIPVNDETIAPPELYGQDRLFVYIRLSTAADTAQDQAVKRLREHGHPLVQIDMRDSYELGAEMFRWEFATALAGSVLGINVFDQPDVEASKIITRELISEFEHNKPLPQPDPVLEHGPLRFFVADNLTKHEPSYLSTPDSVDLLRLFFDAIKHGDYFAILAYLNRLDSSCHSVLQEIRHAVRDKYGVATNLGYGPRYLHAIGQVYKGGPDSGVFLILTTDKTNDTAIPGHRAGFGTVQLSQAIADFSVLEYLGRRLLRVHLGGDLTLALDALHEQVMNALTIMN